MEQKIWRQVCSTVFTLGSLQRQKRVQFSDAWIVRTYFWAVIHDRPTGWACDLANWTSESDPPGFLPSPTTMSRRLRTVGVRRLIELIEAKVSSLFPHSLVNWLDSKALPVGGASKDRDAKVGRAAGGMMAKGYRLHLLYNAAGAVVKWILAPMNSADAVVGEQLIQAAGVLARTQNLPIGGYLVGDNLYDSNTLYDSGAAVGFQLVAPPRKKAKGLGHRKQSPHRLRGLDLARNREIGHDLIESRRGIERIFGTFGNYGGGLGPLPNWVRRPRRVALWVAGKIILDSFRRAIKQGLMS